MGKNLEFAKKMGAGRSIALLECLQDLNWYPGLQISRKKIYEMCNGLLYCSKRKDCSEQNLHRKNKRCLFYPESFMKPRISRIKQYIDLGKLSEEDDF